MKIEKIFSLFFMVAACYPSFAQPGSEDLTSSRWANRQYYLEFVDSSRLIFSSSGYHFTNYTLRGDTINIYYRFSDIRDNVQWPQYRQGWTSYRITQDRNDAVTLNIGDSSIRLVNVDQLKVPLRRLHSLEMSEYSYLTSSGSTDTTGRLVEADTTRTYTTFKIRSSKLICYEGHAFYSWRDGTLISHSQKLMKRSTTRLSRAQRKILRNKLASTLWLFKEPVSVNSSFYYSLRVSGSRRVETTGTYIHPMIADLWQFLKNSSRQIRTQNRIA